MVQLSCSTTWQIYSVQVLLCGIIRFSDTARQRFALSASERLGTVKRRYYLPADCRRAARWIAQWHGGLYAGA